MYHAPKSCTLDMIRALIFNPSSWDSRSALRYFFPGLVTRGAPTSREPINLATPAYIRMQQIIERSDVELLATRASALEGDFVVLPDEPEEDAAQMTYVLDNHGDEDIRSSICPLDVEEALCLVRRIRDGRMNLIQSMGGSTAITADGECDTVDERGLTRIT